MKLLLVKLSVPMLRWLQLLLDDSLMLVLKLLGWLIWSTIKLVKRDLLVVPLTCCLALFLTVAAAAEIGSYVRLTRHGWGPLSLPSATCVALPSGRAMLTLTHSRLLRGGWISSIHLYFLDLCLSSVTSSSVLLVKCQKLKVINFNQSKI